ncbi:erythromycin esterase family protein [Streptomyces sp. NPDC016469]|uniref:erythromycin esterase family protein n=1 Tax=Streptomyces sp. NPDC016469 TaxID=3157191 RepID=UPI0033D2A683
MQTATQWIRHNSHALAARKPDEPLDDLRPLAPLVRDAKIVALGAATRQTRELSEVAHRVVRLLVEEEGFRSVVLEGDDPGRLGLAAYVATGDGDPGAMLAEARAFWRTGEILELVQWMRSYNERHPDDPVRLAQPPAGQANSLAEAERALADGAAWWQRHTGDKVVYWGGMAHTAVGTPRTVSVSRSEPPQTHRNMGGYLRERLGPGFRSIGLTLAHGSIGRPLPTPGPDFVDSVLGAAAGNRAAYLLDPGLPSSGAVRRFLDTPTRTRLIGPSYDPRQDEAHHMSGGSLATWFDAVIHTQEVTSSRPLPQGPAPAG